MAELAATGLRFSLPGLSTGHLPIGGQWQWAHPRQIAEKQLLKRINKTCYQLFVDFRKAIAALMS
jgi:hypothetical protein